LVIIPAVSQPYILFASRRFISQLSLDGNRTSTAVSGLTNAIALDFDYRFARHLRTRMYYVGYYCTYISLGKIVSSGQMLQKTISGCPS